MIAEVLARKTVLVTGSTGFLGKTIVEKCLRSVPQIGRIELAIRPSARRGAEERMNREVLSSPAFRVLRESLGDDGFERLVADKLSVLELDLDQDRLGLDEAGLSRLRACDVVIHSAAAVEFDNPADSSARTNLLGASRLVEELRRSGSRPHLVHISTAFVGGMLRGLVEEGMPFDPGINWRHEGAALVAVRDAVEEESRSPERLKELERQARSRIGPAGTPAVARSVERLRQKWVKDRLVERGRARARTMGFTDIYSFTKALAELAVVELHGDIPLSIVRPSVIESAIKEPFPGWLEGFRMAEPIILAFGRGLLSDFSGLPDAVLDIIPADYVVNAVLAVAASPPESGHRVYHVASGSRNPLRFRGIYEQSKRYFANHPLRDRHGQAIGTPAWTFPSRSELETRGHLALRALEGARWLVERLPLGADAVDVSDRLREQAAKVERGLEFTQLYGVYTEVDCVFETRNLISLFERLTPSEQQTFPFDAGLYEWDHYFQEVHFPTVIKMARAEGKGGRQPSGSTEPRTEGLLGIDLVRRRAGSPRVLAVFDVDGTLVQTNIVEYFLWMRLKSKPLAEWPAFMAEMLRSAPGWLYLERRSRAEFQRSFYRSYDRLPADQMRRLGKEALTAVTLRRLFPEGVRRIREHKSAGHRVLLLTGALDFVVEPLAELLQVEVDCARLIERDGHLTADLEAPPPVGEARSTLLQRYASKQDLDLEQSFAYADAISDLPMMEAVGTPVAVNPDVRLAVVATQRGWRTERWQRAPGSLALPVPDPRSADYRANVWA